MKLAARFTTDLHLFHFDSDLHLGDVHSLSFISWCDRCPHLVYDDHSTTFYNPIMTLCAAYGHLQFSAVWPSQNVRILFCFVLFALNTLPLNNYMLYMYNCFAAILSPVLKTTIYDFLL